METNKTKKFYVKDLKLNDIIVTKDGSLFQIHSCDGVLIGTSHTQYIATFNFNNKYDNSIIKVMRPKSHLGLMSINWTTGDVIWECEEPIIEMTMEEVCKALGKTIKIIK